MEGNIGWQLPVTDGVQQNPAYEPTPIQLEKDESTVSAYAPERPLLPGTPDVRLEDQNDSAAVNNQGPPKNGGNNETMTVCDEERMSCFTTFPAFGDELKRIDFVLVHQATEEDYEQEMKDDKDDQVDGNGEHKMANEEGQKKEDREFTPRESRKYFTDNLLAKGLHLKVVRCGDEQRRIEKECGSVLKSRKKSTAMHKRNKYLIDQADNRSKGKGSSDLVFTLCHAPDDLLLKWCEILRMKMPLQKCDTVPQRGFLGSLWERVPGVFQPFEFPQTVPDEQDPYCYFTAVFTEARKDRFAIGNMGGVHNFFTVGDRNRIVYHILLRTEYDCEENNEEEAPDDVLSKKFGIERMVAEGIYSGAYPLHSGDYDWDPIENGMPWHQSNQLNDRQKLYYSWARWKTFFKKQPLTLIRRYFGEKIGIYFAWLGFYTSFLFPAAVLGVLCFIYGLVTMATDSVCQEICDNGPASNYTMCPLCDGPDCKFWKLGDSCLQVRVSRVIDNEATLLFALFMSLWGIMFLEFWKRRKNELSYEWDLFDYEQGTQVIRPQFERKARLAVLKNEKKKNSWWQTNPVTLMAEPFMPLTVKIPKICATLSIVMFMITVVLGAVIAVIIYRALAAYFFVHQNVQPTLASILTSSTAAFVNLLFIFTFSRMYNVLAFKLTEFECPRTETEFDNSYTLKMFVFQFVNYYSSIVYIAFFKGRFGGYPTRYNLLFDKYRLQECGPGGCLFDLMTQLAIIMVGKQAYSNLQEAGLPALRKWMAKRKLKKSEQETIEGQVIEEDQQEKEEDLKLARWEKDYCLNAQPPLNLFYEYLEMVIQFGFTTLFVAAFPLAPFFAFLNNMVEIKLDAYKFVTQLRRPWAQKAEDIGTWFNILGAIAVLAVLTNGLIIAFTSSFIERTFYFRVMQGEDTKYFDFVTSIAELFDRNTDANVTCRYQGFRYPYNDPVNPYGHTQEFYEMLAVRLGFVLLFENLVFALRQLVAYLVPDMPAHVRIEKAREDYLTRQVLYDAEKKALSSAKAFQRNNASSSKQSSSQNLIASPQKGSDVNENPVSFNSQMGFVINPNSRTCDV